MKYIFSIVLVSAIISAWGQNQETPMVTERAKLLLKSGFEEGVFINDEMTDICGSDVSGFSWDATPSWISSSRFEYVVGKGKNIRNFMEAAIEPTIGPFGKTTRALRLTNIGDDKDHSATSRVEFSFFGKESPDDYQQGFVRYWMKLQGNLGELIPDDRETPFYMLMEWKEPNSNNSMNAQQCKDCCNANAGGTNNYRINIGIVRNAGEKEFSWVIRGEQPQPCRIEEWKFMTDKVKVPLGEWFLVEAFMKKHTSDGRVYFSVNGQVILDTDKARPAGFTGRTQHSQEPMNLRFWSPMKNYHGMEWNKQGPVSQWYDDIELWSDFPGELSDNL